ncbi:ABC-type multidrug transport system, ATPase and permease component [Lachnospiraceae bacterium KH1T2]|nr:ABC-type multidrug transport system, ATPase and permease component [Lachnospiraceae bacterium KH1T2]
MKDILHKLNYIFDKKQKRRMIQLMFAIFIGAMLELVGVSLIMPLINLISKPEVVDEPGIIHDVYTMCAMHSVTDFFVFLVFVIIAIYFFKNLYLTFMYYFQYSFIYKNQLKCASRLVDCYLKKPYTYHLDHNTSEMIRNIMLDTDRLFQLILSVLNVASEILLSLMLALYLLFSDPVMSITMAVILLICVGLYSVLTRKKVRAYGQQNQKYDGKMHQAINQALGAVKDIKILHREKYFVKEFTDCGEKKMTALINTNFFGQVPKYLIETVCITGIMLVLVFKLRTGTDLNTILPQLAAFAVAAFKLLPSVGKISNYLNGITFLKPSIDLIYHDLKETEDMVDVEITDAHQGEIEEKAEKISVENLVYRYPKTDEDVLKNVSFDIPLGASIGLIGPSGAGKSTMADVILGILFPRSGCVKYGSMNVHENPLRWAEKLAYIPQAIFLADESIRSNVAFGIERDKIDEEQVWSALEEAQLADFVRSLPEGLDTEVGERGVRLSGGQRQRIGIARALYGNPEILVLDEATSALDNETEKAVMEAIERLHGKKTLLIIAHRLTTIKNCEYIFKVENGTVNAVDPTTIQA